MADWSLYRRPPSGFEQAMQGLQIGTQLGAGITGAIQQSRQAEAQQAQAERQQQFNSAFGQAFQSGDKMALTNLIGQFPEQFEQIKQVAGFRDEQQNKAFGALGLQIKNAIESGSPQAAAQIIASNADVLRQAGPGYEPESLLGALQQDPEGMARRADTFALTSLGPEQYYKVMSGRDKIEAQMRGQDVQIRDQDIQQQEGQANRALSTRKLQSAEARAAQRLAFDQDKFMLDMQQAQEKAQAKLAEGPKLSVNMEKELTSSIEKAGASQNSAQSLEQLANQFESERPTPGMFGKAADMFTNFTGQEDYLKSLRTKYIGLRNSQLVANLPPGVASDKDIDMALAGFPSEFSNPDTISSFLRGMAKLEQYNTKLNNFKAEWISNNGNPAKSKTAFEVDGFQVKPGETFQQSFKRFASTEQDSQNTGWEIIQ